MKKEEAIEQIKWYFEEDDGIGAEDITKEAVYIAIEALTDRPIGEQTDCGQGTTSMVSNQIEELRKYARKWSEWNGFDAAMPVLPSTNIRLLRSAADTIEALDRPTGKWEQIDLLADRICSVCGYGVWDSEAEEYNYCPNCGAIMNNNDKR